LKGDGYRGTGVVRIHLVTDWADGGQEAAFELSRKVWKALEGLEGERFGCMAPMETQTNHNHEEIVESIDSYAVKYMLDWGRGETDMDWFFCFIMDWF
jgi:hypothetical protein